MIAEYNYYLLPIGQSAGGMWARLGESLIAFNGQVNVELEDKFTFDGEVVQVKSIQRTLDETVCGVCPDPQFLWKAY